MSYAKRFIVPRLSIDRVLGREKQEGSTIIEESFSNLSEEPNSPSHSKDASAKHDSKLKDELTLEERLVPSVTKDQAVELHKRSQMIRNRMLRQSGVQVSAKKPPVPRLSSSRAPRPRPKTSQEADVFEETIDLRSVSSRKDSELPQFPRATSSVSPTTARYNQKNDHILAVLDRQGYKVGGKRNEEPIDEWNRKQESRVKEWDSTVTHVEDLIDTYRSMRNEIVNTPDTTGESVKEPDRVALRTRRGGAVGIKKSLSDSALSSDEEKKHKTTSRFRQRHLHFPHREADLDRFIQNLIIFTPGLRIEDIDKPMEKRPAKRNGRALRPTSISPTFSSRPNSAPSTSRSLLESARSTSQKDPQTSRLNLFELRDKRIELALRHREEERELTLEKYQQKKEEEEAKPLQTSRSVYEQMKTKRTEMQREWDFIMQQRLWFIVVRLCARSLLMVEAMKRRRYEELKKLMRFNASVLIQRTFRKYLARLRARRNVKAMAIVSRVLRKHVSNWRIKRRKISLDIILAFLLSSESLSPAAKAVRTFHLRVIQIQKKWRRYIQMYKAQLELLLLQWDKIEGQMLGRSEPTKSPFKNKGLLRTRSGRNSIEMGQSTPPSTPRAAGTPRRPSLSPLALARGILQSPSTPTPRSSSRRTSSNINFLGTPRRSKFGKSHTFLDELSPQRYTSPIPLHIRELLLRSHIFQANREYRTSKEQFNKDQGSKGGGTWKKVNTLIAKSNVAVAGMFTEQLHVNLQAGKGLPCLRILMRKEAMKRLIEEGYNLMEQERKIDQYIDS